MRYIIITLYSISFFLWIIRKIYYVHDDTEAFFLLLWQLNFDVFVGTFFAFCYFLLKNDFDIFHVLLSPAFLCVLDDSYFPFLWIQKKIIINLSFFCMLQKLTLLLSYVSYLSYMNCISYTSYVNYVSSVKDMSCVNYISYVSYMIM